MVAEVFVFRSSLVDKHSVVDAKSQVVNTLLVPKKSSHVEDSTVYIVESRKSAFRGNSRASGDHGCFVLLKR